MASNCHTADSTSDVPDRRRRTFIKTVGGTSVIGATSMLAGCTGGDDDSDDGDGGSTDGGSTTGGGSDDDGTDTGGFSRGGHLHVALSEDLDGYFQPHNHSSRFAEMMGQSYTETLIRLSRDGSELEPQLATDWEISEDGTTYTFQIREGVQFHPPYDREMTAEDVVENLRLLMDPEYSTRVYGSFEGVTVAGDTGQTPEDAVEATGDYEVTIHLPSPHPPFLHNMQHPAMGIMPPESIEEHGENLGTPDVGAWGTGPFQYVEGAFQDSYTFEAFPDYWDEGEHGELPYLDNITYHVITQGSSRYSSLQAGDVDFAPGIPGNRLQDVEDSDDLTLHQSASARRMDLYTNNWHWEAAQKTEFRQGLDWAINKQAINEALFQGRAENAQGPLPQWHRLHDEELLVDRNPTEVSEDEARQRFEAVGHEDEEFSVVCNATDYWTTAATVVGQNMEQVGLNPQVEPTPEDSGWTRWVLVWNEDGPPQDQESIVQSTGRRTPHADYFLFEQFRVDLLYNLGYYTDETMQDMLLESRSERDDEARDEIYRDIVRYASEDVPRPPLLWTPILWGTRADVRNVSINPFARFVPHRVWLDR